MTTNKKLRELLSQMTREAQEMGFYDLNNYCPKCNKFMRDIYKGALCESCGEELNKYNDSRS